MDITLYIIFIAVELLAISRIFTGFVAGIFRVLPIGHKMSLYLSSIIYYLVVFKIYKHFTNENIPIVLLALIFLAIQANYLYGMKFLKLNDSETKHVFFATGAMQTIVIVLIFYILYQTYGNINWV